MLARTLFVGCLAILLSLFIIEQTKGAFLQLVKEEYFVEAIEFERGVDLHIAAGFLTSDLFAALKNYEDLQINYDQKQCYEGVCLDSVKLLIIENSTQRVLDEITIIYQ